MSPSVRPCPKIGLQAEFVLWKTCILGDDPVSNRAALVRVRKLIAGLDEAVANDDLRAARRLLGETAAAIQQTGIRRRTIPSASESVPPPKDSPSKRSTRGLE
jgi:hypothetical protein